MKTYITDTIINIVVLWWGWWRRYVTFLQVIMN